MGIRHATAVLASALVVGCASAPMQEHQYPQFAAQWVTANKCGESGKVSPEVAGQVVARMRNYLRDHPYDQAHLDRAVRDAQHAEPTQTECNKMAMALTEQSTTTPAAVQPPVTTNQPTHTFCNKVGTQTLCTSM